MGAPPGFHVWAPFANLRARYRQDFKLLKNFFHLLISFDHYNSSVR